jgi:hypothetical protein
MRFGKYLAKSFLFYTVLGAGVGLGSTAGALLVLRADEILKKNREGELKATKIETPTNEAK